MIKLTCLMDNMPSENKALRAEHGLSLYIETEDASFLFDCGSGESTVFNAHKLGIDLKNVRFTVCSHSHYDHAAGFRDMAEQGMGGKTLYTGEGFFERKYANNAPKYTDLSCGFTADFLQQQGISQQVITGCEKIVPGVYAIGGFSRGVAFETVPKRFVKGTLQALTPDLFDDEICLAIDTEQGIVIVVGCSHPGILNIANTVYARMQKPIYAILGGTHLVEAEPLRIQKTVAALKEMGLAILGLSHCSGTLAEEMVKQDAAVQCCHLAVGDCIAFKKRR
ncbi:MAG: MBL fold metallo-hydrolase [Eubacteriales bacterium]|nr:MBL fold metallo-hydrolase [Eubacteriales bacterium]